MSGCLRLGVEMSTDQKEQGEMSWIDEHVLQTGLNLMVGQVSKFISSHWIAHIGRQIMVQGIFQQSLQALWAEKREQEHESKICRCLYTCQLMLSILVLARNPTSCRNVGLAALSEFGLWVTSTPLRHMRSTLSSNTVFSLLDSSGDSFWSNSPSQ